MVSLGMFASRAARMADRSRALWSGSPPPFRAATVTSRISLVKSAPLVAPIASFLRLILVQRLWPDILCSSGELSITAVFPACRQLLHTSNLRRFPAERSRRAEGSRRPDRMRRPENATARSPAASGGKQGAHRRPARGRAAAGSTRAGSADRAAATDTEQD